MMHIWSKPGEGTPVVVCERCGCIVAAEFQTIHNEFHEGLAELWNQQVN